MSLSLSLSISVSLFTSNVVCFSLSLSLFHSLFSSLFHYSLPMLSLSLFDACISPLCFYLCLSLHLILQLRVKEFLFPCEMSQAQKERNDKQRNCDTIDRFTFSRVSTTIAIPGNSNYSHRANCRCVAVRAKTRNMLNMIDGRRCCNFEAFFNCVLKWGLNLHLHRSGCDTVVRQVASNTKEPGFKSRHWQFVSSEHM